MVIYNEIEVINIFSKITSNTPKGVVGIGDDCAILPNGDTDSVVVTTDTLTENTHFIFDKITPTQLAYKALASNISDVIAMGASPTYAFLSITLNDRCDTRWIEDFACGFKQLADRHNISLLGGDTTRSGLAVTITITLMGSVKNSDIKLRSEAKDGDTIFCLAPLGASAAGLKMLLAGKTTHPLIDIHYEGVWLGSREHVHAMMDISDGIAKDLRHILERSNVGAHIDIEKIPINDTILQEPTLNNADHTSLALEGGEEYSPLFTVSGDFATELIELYKDRFNMDIYPIGSISSGIETSIIEWRKDGIKQDTDYKGYVHCTTQK